jgi:hypothetical protein
MSFSENEIEYSTHDRLLMAWENSKELVRDFEMYSKRIEEEEIKTVFKKFAEEQGMQARQLRELLLKHKQNS